MLTAGSVPVGYARDMRTIAAVASGVLVFGCSAARPRPDGAGDPIVARIAALEDARHLGDGELARLASAGGTPEHRARAVLALGRIQSPSSLETIAAGLTDRAAVVRGEAAFALGLLAQSWAPLDGPVKSRLSEVLLAALAVEAEPEVRARAIDAAGRVGSVELGRWLVDRLRSDEGGLAGIALGVAVKRGLSTPEGAAAIATEALATTPSANVRFGLAYFLAQAKTPAALPGLRRAVLDVDPEVRTLGAKGLGDVGEDGDAGGLEALLSDGDWRVAAEAARALAKHATKCSAACPALQALKALSARVDRLAAGDLAHGGQPLLALAQQGLDAKGRSTLEPLFASLQRAREGATIARTRWALANVECRFAAALDRLDGAPTRSRSCGGGLIPEPMRLAQGLTEIARDAAKRSDAPAVLAATAPSLEHASPRVQAAALGVLAELSLPEVLPLVRPVLQRSDVAVFASAVAAVGKRKDVASISVLRAHLAGAVGSIDRALPLIDALQALEARDAKPELEACLGSPQPSIRHAAAAALSAFAGARVEAPHVDGEVQPPAAPSGLRTLVLRTGAGEIEIALDADTPRTGEALVALARRGFYSNLTFHRVVPGFVVQGGDPRGDGEGGPGSTLRCEVGHRRYERGTVGMALSGKDTGGSQFFVTHAKHPHLDGRYATVGQVVRGLELVDALLEGDALESIDAR